MNSAVRRRRFIPDENVGDDGQLVMVPRHEKLIVATLPERAERLREHLAGVLCASRPRPDPERPPRPELEGFTVRVDRTACSFCKGFCCGISLTG
jgi:hypothetical protein